MRRQLGRRKQNDSGPLFSAFTEIIAYHLELESHEYFDGEIEVDESYFGGRRKGKRGLGTAEKVSVFRLLKHCDKVYIKVIPDAKSEALLPNYAT